MRGAARTRGRGFTVIEVVVTLALAAVVLTGLGGVVRSVIQITRLHEHRLDMQQGSRRAIERVLEELRWAGDLIPDPACGPGGLCPDRVRASIPTGNPYRRDAAYEVTFQHNARQHELERRVGAGTTNLAAMIRRAEFTYFDRHGVPTAEPGAVVRIRVTLVTAPRDGPPVVLESDVALRNRRPVVVVTPSPSPTASPTPAWRPTPRRLFGPGSPWSQDAPPPHDAPGLR